MNDSQNPMIKVSLLLPRRVWDAIARYARESAEQAGSQSDNTDALLALADPARMAALMLEQAVENEEELRRMARSEN